MENRAAIIFAIKDAIEIAYTNGVARILNYRFENGSIVGRFLDSGRVYSFKIASSGIEFQEVKPKRNDGYIVGYLAQLHGKQDLVRLDGMEDWASYLIRLDAVSQRKKSKCEKGSECGGTCIAKGDRCNVKSGQAKKAAAKVLAGFNLASNATTSPPAVYAKVEADERELRLNSYETAIVYDAAGQELFRKKGGSSEVVFTATETAKMKDAIVTHNHPALTVLDPQYDRIYQGGSFSSTDMIAASALDVAEIRAVGPEGTYRLVRPAKGWPSPAEMDRVYKKTAKVEYGDALDQIREGRKTHGAAQVEYWGSTSEKTAKELGVEYSFTRSGVTKADREAIDRATESGRKQFKADISKGINRDLFAAGIAVSAIAVIGVGVSVGLGVASAGGPGKEERQRRALAKAAESVKPSKR